MLKPYVELCIVATCIAVAGWIPQPRATRPEQACIQQTGHASSNHRGPATASVGGATMPHPAGFLRPNVGQALRERRDQHVVGAQACWRGRGATQSPTPWARGARYSVLAAWDSLELARRWRAAPTGRRRPLTLMSRCLLPVLHVVWWVAPLAMLAD